MFNNLKMQRKTGRFALLVICFLVFLAGSVLAPDARAQSVSPSATGTLKITMKTSNGTTIPPHNIEIKTGNTTYTNLDHTRPGMFTGSTAIRTKDTIPVGEYTIRVSPIHSAWSASASPSTFTISEGQTTEVTATFTPAGSIRVITKTSDRRPLPAGAGFTFSQEPGSFGGASYPMDGNNQQTFYEFTTTLGDYQVAANSVEGWNVSVDPTTVQTLGQGGLTAFTVTYTKKTYTISGTVTDDWEHFPVSGFVITMTGDKSGTVTTGADGKYSFTVEHGDSVTITAAKTGYSVESGGSLYYANVTSDKSGRDIFVLRDKGHLRVFIDRGSSNGSFSISGPTGIGDQSDFANIGGQTTEFSEDVPTGDYEVVFSEEPGYNTSIVDADTFTINGNKVSGRVAKSDVVLIIVYYTLKTGSLAVNVATDPNHADTNNNATWTVTQLSSVSGEDFSASGSGMKTLEDVPLGTYKISYTGVRGWQTPADETITISEGAGTASLTGTYELKTGSLTVNVESDPNYKQATNNATWTVSAVSTVSGVPFEPVTGTGTQTLEDVPLGTYEVVYDDLTGWITPETDTVTVEEAPSLSPEPSSATSGNNAEVTGTYILQTGELTVNITTSIPSAEILSTSSWSISGTSVGGPTFSTSGVGSGAVTIPTGNYTISYSDFDLWDTPADETFSLAASGGSLTGHYERHTGGVEVFITPDAAIADGAQWRATPSMGWRPSGTSAEGIPTGKVYVELHEAADFYKPVSIPVNITKNTLKTVYVNYSQDLTGTGNLQINIVGADGGSGSAPGKVSAAPQWRFAGSDTWYGSGAVVANINNGDYDIEFSVVSGHVLPSQTSVKVRPGIENLLTAEYLKPLIAHKSDYDGDGTEDLAIRDARTRKWSIATSGATKGTPAARMILEKKFGSKESIPTPGDYDGDGIADLAYFLDSKGEWRVLKQFKLKGFGQEGDIPVPGDYNGDGMTDAALYRPATGQWLIYNRDRNKTMTVNFGTETEIPVPGNYDGDKAGMTDLAVYDVTSGTWRVAVYNARKNKWVSKKTLGATFGAVGEMPVQADYDGDGSTDIAVFNRLTNTWKVKGQFEIELGIEGDIPVPNDWAGLGKAIPAVFRPETGAWLALDNLLKTRFGTGGTPLISGK